MRGHFRLEGALEGALELNQLDGVHGKLGLSYFECEVTSDWKARWNGTSCMADTGSWDCLISDARSLQTGRRVGRRVGVEPAGWRTREVGTVLFRMRGHFRLEGALEWNQLHGGHGELGLSYFGCEVTSDWKARWKARWS